MSAQDWLNWLAVDHSQTTIDGYAWEIAQLGRFFLGEDIDRLDTSRLLMYVAARRKLAGRRNEQMSDASIRRTVNALRSFYAFIGSPAAKGIPLPQVKTRVQRTLTWVEAEAILSECDTSTLLGRRNLALMSLMLDAGLRAAEICRLSVNKVDLDARLMYVVTKGGHEKFGCYSFVTANHLSAWLAMRSKIARCERVFCSLEMHRVGGELSTEGLRCIFRALGQRSGVRGFTPHVLRRSFATFMTLLGAPTRLTQMAGRWARLEEVEQYTRAAQIDPDVIAPYLPMNRLGR